MRAPQTRAGDEELLADIQRIVAGKPTFGYRRVTALLRRSGRFVNHKRIYRLMHRSGLLLERYAPKPERPHDGKIITLASNLRWCSDGFEIRCWNGE
jgi:putative transposase